MRPEHLSIEGLASYRERQELDLGSHNQLAIVGPTGSGKTTILDALSLALYGKVPRVGKSCGEMISLGRDRAVVRLDFRIQGRHFRITRIIKRERPTEAQLDEIVDGEERPIATGVRPVDQKIEELLGLDYDAFVQSVVLPQGQFARFLQAPAGDQRKMLIELLRLQVYDRMRERAAQHKRDLEKEVDTQRRRLSEDFGNATPEAEAALEQQLRDVAARVREAAQALQALEERVTEQRTLRAWTVERDERRGGLTVLEGKKALVEQQQRELEQARRAAPIIPLLDTAEAAEKQAALIAEKHAVAQEELRAARQEHAGASAALKAATKEAAKLPALQKRIQALDRVMGHVEARETARTRAADVQRELEELEKPLRDARKEVERTEAALLARRAELTKAGDSLEAVGYEKALHERIDRLRDAAHGLETLRVQSADGEEARATADAEELSKAAAAAEKESHEFSARVEALDERLRTTRAELDEARARHAAAHLRGQLRVGEDCPVCEQQVQKRPRALAAPGLDRLEARAKKLEAERSQLARESADARSHASATRARASDASKHAQTHRTKAERLRRTLVLQETALSDKARRLGLRWGRGKVERRVLAAVDEQQALRDRFEKARAAHVELERASLQLQQDANKAEATLGRLQATEAERQQALASVQREIQHLDETIARVTKSPDPTAEREELEERVKELEAALHEAQALEQKHAKVVTRLEEREQQLADKAGEARERARLAAERARSEAKEAGFRSVRQARDAALSKEEQNERERSNGAWKMAVGAAQRRLGELDRQLSGRRVEAEDMERAEGDLSARRGQHEALRDEESTLTERLGRLRDDLARAAQLVRELQEAEAKLALYAQLATLLGGRGFQQFILDETFRNLAHGASERLFDLSNGRYKLDYDEHGFQVVDFENAGEIRSAETLSGGETFLASLSLALELSEEVQRASGAVLLDSLFIDEGFGTLDPEALDTLANALESLQAGGRMVGIITHIPELAARMPARVLVERSASGSRVHLEVAE